jgi:quercetin dioxygenase-like cupin family protein
MKKCTFNVSAMLFVTPILAMSILFSSAAPATTPSPSTVAIFAPIHPLLHDGERVVGNPDKAGVPFVVRLFERAGSIVPPHIHHFDENITIVAGTWYFGIGAKFDPAKLHKLPVGSFVFIPRGTPMFGYAPEAVTVQIHGIGPFEQHWLAPLYTLTAAGARDTAGSSGVDPSRFRFHLGQAVRSPRGDGKISEGYAFGEIIEYYVLRANGQLIVAQEKELAPQ